MPILGYYNGPNKECVAITYHNVIEKVIHAIYLSEFGEAMRLMRFHENTHVIAGAKTYNEIAQKVYEQEIKRPYEDY